MRPTSATVVSLGVLMLLWATPAAAENMTVCAGPQGQLRKIEEGGSCRPSESGPFTLSGGGGGGSVNYAWAFVVPGMSPMLAACTNQLSPTGIIVPIPSDAGAGLLVVTGKHRVRISQTAGNFPDFGSLNWSTAANDCAVPDTDRSHFGLPATVFPGATDIAVFTQRSFPVLAASDLNPGCHAGQTCTFYLNSQMNSILPDDTVGEDYVVFEFHKKP